MIIKLTPNKDNKGRTNMLELILTEVQKMSYLFGYDVEVINIVEEEPDLPNHEFDF
jgi:hypothetical protein